MILLPKNFLWLVCLLLILGSVFPVQAECKDQAPDKSYCGCLYNLMPENVFPPDTPRIHGPAVVDINLTSGNLLVRGPLPLMVRNGTGTEKDSPCMNSTDWYFAYDELNATIRTSQYRPAYLTDLQRKRLDQTLGSFNLSEYELIVISLIKHTGADNNYLAVEKREFGGTSSQCAAPLQPGTLRGQPAYLVTSPVGFCDKGEEDPSCSELLFNGTGDFCSYAGLIDQVSSLMQGTANSGRKRLVYYHCIQGTDRTGGVTIGYLLKNYPGNMTYLQALNYAQFLGNRKAPPHYDPPNRESQYLAHAYCIAINGSCAKTPQEAASDEPEAPIMALVQPGGAAGLPVSYIFDDYDDQKGSSSLADTIIHHVHVIPSRTIIDPILRVERSPDIGEAQKLTGRIFTRYYDINLLNVPDTAIDPSTIEFSIREEYLRSLRIIPEDVVMLRREQDRWVELPTVLNQVINGRVYYTAWTPGFSYFVITNRVPAPAATPWQFVPSPVQETPGSTPQPVPPVTSVELPAPETSGTLAPALVPAAEIPPPAGIPLPAVIGIAGLIAAGGLVIRSWWRRRQNPALFRKDD